MNLGVLQACVRAWRTQADAELQKRRKTEDAVAVSNVAEDERVESDSGAFLVGPCNGEDPEQVEWKKKKNKSEGARVRVRGRGRRCEAASTITQWRQQVKSS